MRSMDTTAGVGKTTMQRAVGHFQAHQQHIYQSTDRLFIYLMVVQWFAGIALAYWISPRTWAGQSSQVHPHVWAAIFLGGTINLFPVLLALINPGRTSTRHAIAIGQMLMSALLIHLTGGRIETHFHVFGSLAFLAFYRDWRVLIPATLVTTLDHLVRGVFWPQSVYGVLSAGEWRWLEHAGWVLFEDIFLCIACLRSTKEMWGIAERQASLETLNESVEQQVLDQTADFKASEERFRLLSAAAPIGIFQTDVKGRCIYTNARWQARSGLSLEESLGDGWLRGLHPEDRKAVFAKWTAAVRDGVEFAGEFRFQTRQGNVRWVDARATAFLSEDGRPNGYVGTVTDITERKQAEQERDRIFSLSRDLICVAGFDGYFKYLNPSWESELGFTNKELLTLPFIDIVHPDDVAATLHEVRKLARGEEVQGFEIRGLCADGSYKWYLWSATPFVAENVFYAFGKDITPRKWAEAEILLAKDAAEFANRELEAANRQLELAIEATRELAVTAEAASSAKSEFLANMSHEIRTPMNGILGMTELTLDTDLTAEQREYVGLIKTSADSLLTVINDILDFSKIEAGKLSLDPVAFDLRECIEETMKALALRAHEKGLELACCVGPDVPEAVTGDSARLRQILVNLVGNAIKFTKQGEVVVDVDSEAQGDGQTRLHFTVRDTGIGIPAGRQARIFEAFTQADGSTTRQYGGTGLGLTISSQLVALMGGRMWVESDEGRGSTFHFTAQFGVQRDPLKKPVLPGRTDLIGLPVLVVDDNATNRRILEGTLTNWGMRPVAVEGGQAALRALQQARESQKPFALALLDCRMPEMDGFMLAGEIMRRPGLEGTPLIMLTSAGQTRDCERRRALGIRACLTKPAKQSDLLQAIIKTLGQSPQSVTRPALSAQTAPTTGGKAMRILLAEDNVVNQRLAVRLLEKHGHTVLVTNNGGEAIAALEREPFDLALMDVQMPEMSGLEATARIRERERATGARLPIIALTAYAMKGDRERCLEAGMDGYVSKPIQSAELFKLVAELTPIEQVARQAGKSEEQAEEVFDRAAALSLAGGDQELLAELAELFAADCLRLLTELGQAIARGESKGVECVAHTLAGTASNFGGRRVAVLARQLEELGRAENVIEAKPYYALLEVEVKQLTSALGALVGKNPGWKPGGGEPVAV